MATLLSAAQHAALKAELATAPYAGLTQAQMRDAINAPTALANPTPRGQVPAPFTASDLVSAVAAANRPALGPILQGAAAGLIVAQDSPHLAAGIDALVLVGALASADATAMKAVLARTVPDPAWPATVAGPTRAEAVLGAGFAILDPADPTKAYHYVSLAMIAEALS